MHFVVVSVVVSIVTCILVSNLVSVVKSGCLSQISQLALVSFVKHSRLPCAAYNDDVQSRRNVTCHSSKSLERSTDPRTIYENISQCVSDGVWCHCGCV
ncbi:hypothetical protein B0J13DRAFT_134630 [Dactylonectria estremocensis]|uniref:Uncharacterized protein n=1 Tax=Dactylonectria estremocensis TaxID=1079267 RepID=A0A9P9E4U8_9HYPO|nr:hypothetical protein B0J13DRAFT_134630 [Dactylonectria estremocensis]